MNELTTLIRNSAVVLYFKPFATIKLDRMSAAFGWTVGETEDHIVNLIQSGAIHGRVDSENKVCFASDVLTRIMGSHEDLLDSTRQKD